MPDVIERYEVLRANVLNSPASFPYGYSFFVNQGLLAWSRSCHKSFDDHSPKSRGSVSFPKETTALFIQIITNMVIQVHQEVCYG